MQIELKILNKELYGLDYRLDSLYEQYLPSYATSGSAAIDLICTEDITIYPGETKQIHTGIAIHIGSYTDTPMKAYREHWDYAGLIIPRSGLGTKGLILANTVGLIDSDYQGELLVQAWNRLPCLDVQFRQDSYDVMKSEYNKIEIDPGDRFAQLVIVPIARATWKLVDEFTSITDRGAGGFGHTGE